MLSYFTHVDVGGAQEGVGQTGMAHMFEHMAFKGTDRIGTNNFAAEKGPSTRSKGLPGPRCRAPQALRSR